MKSYKKLILASASPSRKNVLEKAGLIFSVFPALIDEREIESSFSETDISPEKRAVLLAEAKAIWVSRQEPEALIIGADQILSLENEILHKPRDMKEARSHLLSLAGKTHCLNAGVVLVGGGKKLWEYTDIVRLTMRPLLPSDIDLYLSHATPEILKTVGAYQIEKEAIKLFDEIEGSYFTIMGLPLLALLRELRRMGMLE